MGERPLSPIAAGQFLIKQTLRQTEELPQNDQLLTCLDQKTRPAQRTISFGKGGIKELEMRSFKMSANAGTGTRNGQKAAKPFTSCRSRDMNAPQEYRVAYLSFIALVILFFASVALIPLMVLWIGIQHQNGFLFFAGIAGSITTYAFAWALWCDDQRRKRRRQ